MSLWQILFGSSDVTPEEIAASLDAYADREKKLAPLRRENGLVFDREHKKLEAAHPNLSFQDKETVWPYEVSELCPDTVTLKPSLSAPIRLFFSGSAGRPKLRVGHDISLSEAEKLRKGQQISLRLRLKSFCFASTSEWQCWAELVSLEQIAPFAPPHTPDAWRTWPALEPLTGLVSICTTGANAFSNIPNDNGILRKRAVEKWQMQYDESLLGKELLWPFYVDTITEERVEVIMAQTYEVIIGDRGTENLDRHVHMKSVRDFSCFSHNKLAWKVGQHITLPQAEKLTHGQEFFFPLKVVQVTGIDFLVDPKEPPRPDSAAPETDDYVRAFRHFFEVRISLWPTGTRKKSCFSQGRISGRSCKCGMLTRGA
ncbi:MAG: hypothetical protein FJ303_26325 [Planctomycetes bacterium]|nr:hypothetical protein [Planctomycetota bacterium]